VCNTLNVCCIVNDRAHELIPRFLAALEAAGERREAPSKLHVVRGTEDHVPTVWFERTVDVQRAEGPVAEPQAELLDVDALGREWEWEGSPEVTLVVIEDVEAAVDLFNRHSPRLVGTLVSDDPTEQELFWSRLDAPFVGDGFTRWVDGQYALGRPELGLSNWQHGRLLARSGVLSGDSVFTVRTRAYQQDPDLHR
jgi:glutamate-5-semialdehyde dehydrogenase